MAKHGRAYDPDFKVEGNKTLINARITYSYINKFLPKINLKNWNR